MGNCMSSAQADAVGSQGSERAAKPAVGGEKSGGQSRAIHSAGNSPAPEASPAAGKSGDSSDFIGGNIGNNGNHGNNDDNGSTGKNGKNGKNGSNGNNGGSSSRGRTPGYSSGASTPDDRSADGSEGSFRSASNRPSGNPKMLSHSTSAIGLDEMIETRREDGDLRQNVVHIEVPFGKPIEEVYDGVHTGPVLGSGISGLVRLVTHKATGIKYAVKCLDLGLVDTAEGLHQLREEIFIMCQLDHPNIVRLEEVYESHSEIYLVQELCLGGELFDRLDEQPDYHYTEAQCARLVKNMLCAVRYLHSKGIIHRDLKLENFLFSSTAQDSELKMIDFGLSKHFRYGEVQHEAVGTPYTVAPEVIKGSYDERCDIWAIGVITFLLLSGDPPFGGCGGPEPLMTVRANILRGSFAFEPEDIWATVSPLAREYIKKLLVVDPKKRPTAKEAQKHAWLKEWASRTKREDDNVLNPNVVKALVNFKEFSDMRKLLCEVLSFTLLPDQIKELRGEFEKMDKDESGEISLAALKEVLMTNAGAGSLGALTEEEVEDIFNAMRVRKTETRIHWHEFLAAGLSQCQVDDRNLRLAFDRLDSDHKGYITLDDIMDLMGNDATQSEEAMRRMWGDSMKLVKGHARITYDDFLLLMKGQTTDATEFEKDATMFKLGTTAGRLGQSTKLEVVPEVHSPDMEASKEVTRVICSADKIKDANSTSGDQALPTVGVGNASKPAIIQKPALIPDFASKEELDSPFSIEEADDGYGYCEPGVPGTVASLTPPMTPTRGAQDYITPLSGRRSLEFLMDNCESMMMPGLPSSVPPRTGFGAAVNSRPGTESTGGSGSESSGISMRRRARSLGTEEDGGDRDTRSDTKEKDEKEKKNEEEKERLFEKNVRRAMMLPEHDHTVTEIDDLVKDETKSALVVNRKLYRAHRQMRLAVLDASKRFEEQQQRHARDVILAQRDEEVRLYHAGLVMRHGHKEQVSSEAVIKLLKEHREKQEVLVEKATRQSGRGRRSRKKTFSDMSGMLSSRGQDELSDIALQAAATAEATGRSNTLPQTIESPTELQTQQSAVVLPSSNEMSEEGKLRGATVPGEFRKTKDPFGAEGKYGGPQRLDLIT